MSTRYDDTWPLGVVARPLYNYKKFDDKFISFTWKDMIYDKGVNQKRCTALLNELKKRGLTVIDNLKT